MSGLPTIRSERPCQIRAWAFPVNLVLNHASAFEQFHEREQHGTTPDPINFTGVCRGCCGTIMPGMLYRFGQFEFDSQTRLLFRAQKTARPPKAADLLLVLLEHEGRLLGKDELLRLVWPDSFVEEGSLSKHIFSLRKTLEDQGESAQFIETIPKRGYRFIGSLERTAEEERGSAVAVEEMTREHLVIETQDVHSTWYRRPRPVLALVSALILIVGAVAWSLRSRGRVERPLRSLLVLPFANMGPSENEYFSDGLTHELIAALSAVKGLRVIPRTTAFQFKGRSGDLRAIGRQLDVDAVLDGGVHAIKAGFASIWTTRVDDGYTEWSRSYDRPASDVFATEDDVTAEVLRALFPNDRHSLDGLPLIGTKSVEAHNLYLKGNFFQKTEYNIEQALKLYQAASQLDPMYPEAWAGLASCYMELGYGYQRYPKDVLPLAVQAAQRALQLKPASGALARDPGLPECDVLAALGPREAGIRDGYFIGSESW